MGQWTRGGMTMVGDMFNNALKAKVDGLCAELSDLLAQEPVLARAASSQSQSQRQGGGGNALGEASLFVPAGGENVGGWWPAELGAPSSTGSQNNLRYAYFPEARRLAVDIAGKLTVYRHARPPDRWSLAAARLRCLVHLCQSAGDGSVVRSSGDMRGQSAFPLVGDVLGACRRLRGASARRACAQTSAGAAGQTATSGRGRGERG